VAPHRLPHYLRTHRRRSGFSQTEIAALLGTASSTKVSRYETFTRMPAVETIWAYEVVFNQPASELFAGCYEAVRQSVQVRAGRMLRTLLTHAAEPYPPRIARKLALLRAIVEQKPDGSAA
jgi:transcriptional regulator with XRE-family HTH domain